MAVLAPSFADANPRSATMNVRVTVSAVISFQNQTLVINNLPVVAAGTVGITAPAGSSPPGVASGTIGGPAIGGHTLPVQVGAVAFTRNVPIGVTMQDASLDLVCRSAFGGTTAVTIGSLTFTGSGTIGTSCSSVASGACGVWVQPVLNFPADIGTGGCTNGTLIIPLIYATS